MSPRSLLVSFIQVCLVPLPNPLSDYQCQSIPSNLALPSKAKVSIAIANERWGGGIKMFLKLSLFGIT